ncbi:carbon-monoxide dehydrogenase small subunit [Rhodoligotrophos appendicifer]|uniref:(2Fe-2S)-binding protein n=1 Tax=Rhodoligotrophos appendicifer TaxID=987056 RepID=UPI00117EAD79|nr:(2Fe-2S)-binding protein [Rhodoligotrophos appendicifer]
MDRMINFKLNGRPVEARIAPHHTLVELLQEEFALFGARESCGQGLCGCCTVRVDGETVSGCLYLAAFADGTEIETIEGHGTPDALDPVQEAFIETGAFQCGFCTPGFIMMAKRLLEEHPDPEEHEIRDYLSGNLCRCGAYPEIVKAVQLAAHKQKAVSASHVREQA